jgi:tetratricopeptide (TPR) repeat protein
VQKPDGQRVLPIIMPSGFGKTSLVTKLLREVTDGTRPTLPGVRAVVFVRCRKHASLLSLFTDADRIFGTQELQTLYTVAKTVGGDLQQLARDFFAYLSALGDVWIVLDNFESWLDDDHRIKDDEIRQWMECSLELHHSVRLILTSQFLPQLSTSRLQNKLKRLPEVERGLDAGLPEADALKYLRAEGAECGLASVPKAALKQFVTQTHRIPSALESLIGYLSGVFPDKTFDELMRDPQLQGEFRKHDREAGSQYLIRLQLSTLKPEERTVLSALAFFGTETSRQALSPLASDDKLTNILNRLHKNRLIRFRRNIFNELRYSVQPYIAQNDELCQWTLQAEYADTLTVLGQQAWEKHNLFLAFNLENCAEIIYRALVGEGRTELRSKLARTVMTRGLALMCSFDNGAAVAAYDEAIKINRKLIAEGYTQSRQALAQAVMNRGAVLIRLNQLAAAVEDCDEAIRVYRALVAEGSTELRIVLAGAVRNRGLALSGFDNQAAVAAYDEAIKINRKLIAEGYTQSRQALAQSLASKGQLLHGQQEYESSLALVEEAIALLEQCANDGQDDFHLLLINCTVHRDGLKRLLAKDGK